MIVSRGKSVGSFFRTDFFFAVVTGGSRASTTTSSSASASLNKSPCAGLFSLLAPKRCCWARRNYSSKNISRAACLASNFFNKAGSSGSELTTSIMPLFYQKYWLTCWSDLDYLVTDKCCLWSPVIRRPIDS